MGNKKDQIPDNMSILEASEFWDSHSVADYPSKETQFEFQAEEKITYVAISNEIVANVEKRAKMNGVSVETLVNLWIQEKLAG